MKILLVVAYLSMYGEPSIRLYEQSDMASCRKMATTIYQNVRAGSARVWCQKIAQGVKS